MSTGLHHTMHDVVQHLAASPSVAAVAVVGSTATGRSVPGSDVDVFVYTDGDLSGIRSGMAAEFADHDQWQSVGETAFGDGDVWRLNNGGPWLDLMYWSPRWAEDQLHRVLVEHRPSLGYSTAFWRSIRDAQPVYERDAWHPVLQQTARQPYPDELRANIVAANYPYLRDHVFSFRNQVAKAIQRGDLVSINHRIAAWLASYFDIIFAVNRVLHPGEKGLLEFVHRECPLAPQGLTMGMDRLLQMAGDATSQLLGAMDEMVDELRDLLLRERLLAEELRYQGDHTIHLPVRLRD